MECLLNLFKHIPLQHRIFRNGLAGNASDHFIEVLRFDACTGTENDDVLGCDFLVSGDGVSRHQAAAGKLRGSGFIRGRGFRGEFHRLRNDLK